MEDRPPQLVFWDSDQLLRGDDEDERNDENHRIFF